MNIVIQDGKELHNVTVTIVNGVATVTPNATPGPSPSPYDGGGPGPQQH